MRASAAARTIRTVLSVALRYIGEVRVLVVADIHSNLSAFEAVIKHAEKGGSLDAIWALGDLVGYNADPGACIALLRSYPCVAVAGNHDRAAVGQVATDDFNEHAAAAAQWTSEVLSGEERDFLAELPDIAIEEPFTLVHGSLRDPIWEYIMSAEAADAHLARQWTPYGFIGHTHLPLVFEEVVRGASRRKAPRQRRFPRRWAARASWRTRAASGSRGTVTRERHTPCWIRMRDALPFIASSTISRGRRSKCSWPAYRTS